MQDLAGLGDARAYYLMKAAADDRLEDEVVGGAGQAEADAGVELPFRRDVQVDRGEDLLLALSRRVETGERAVRAVVLDAEVDLAGDVERHRDVGRELRRGP